jgi:hemolysin activation/secretion protein
MRASQGLQAAFSDMMGNHMIFVGVGNGTLSTTDFLRNFSASVSYVNLSRRLNYGLSVFHFGGDFYDELGYPYYQRRAGIGALLRYPMNRYERIETNLSVAYDETNHPTTGFNRRGMIGTHSVSYIRDTSLWMSTGPIDGQRFNLTAGLTLNLQHGEAENTALMLDWRRYMRLGMLTSYAVRVQGRWSEGQDPEIFLLGGSLSLRCWPDQAFAGTRTVMLNQELRVPLVRGLVLGLPFGNMELPGVQGAMFLDAGSAWYRGWSPPWIGSYGFGFRMGLGGYLVLRLDVGWRTDFERFHGDTHTDFFLGWNY